MTSKLNDFLNSASDRSTVSATGWLDSPSADEIEALYSDLGQTFAQTVDECRKLLGLERLSDDQDREWLDTWYPEAIKFAAWPRPSGELLYVSLEHQDREAPVAVLLGRVSEREITERSA